MRQAVVMALVLVLAFAVQQSAAQANTKATLIPLNTFYSLWKASQTVNATRAQNITFLDVRPKTLYQLSHVPDARNVPSQNAKKVAGQFASRKRGVDPTKDVACYCTQSSTAVSACNEFAKLKAYSKVKVYALDASFSDWVVAKYPTEKSGKFGH
ncbi:hypothetical protein CHLRE_01g028950v5 [Chlamydomonas reinhardtii]|uniref:Rhodanese domain-containing protein n=1 Tax=Chlamydomonas reinhardtii TaxID=3055 RepID=A0A2K3E6L6_CHLRE|nr:uncharacterized protein CHLRE_01g028950v5 [Chlamydomonas reinhardtii]PNW88426.1 hypothetical protein CHLRE_01g028950v5 [Chlamydomonas reinhardtii]